MFNPCTIHRSSRSFLELSPMMDPPTIVGPGLAVGLTVPWVSRIQLAWPWLLSLTQLRTGGYDLSYRAGWRVLKGDVVVFFAVLVSIVIVAVPIVSFVQRGRNLPWICWFSMNLQVLKSAKLSKLHGENSRINLRMRSRIVEVGSRVCTALGLAKFLLNKPRSFLKPNLS